VGACVVVAAVVWVAAVSPMRRSRARAQEALCEAQMRQITMACLTYASEHGGRRPGDLSKVFDLLGPSVSVSCPTSKRSYEYFPPGSVTQNEGDPSRCFILTCDAHHIVAYADGHLEGGTRSLPGARGGR
jgi:hypothetical protein